MTPTIGQAPLASEGNPFATSFQSAADVERLGKTIAVRCLTAAIDSFLIPRNLSRRQLAEDLCGMTEANFSKVTNAQQGDFWALVYKLPGDMRRDFFERLNESERVDPLWLAMEQMNAAMWRVLRLSGGQLPERAAQMAKALADDAQERQVA